MTKSSKVSLMATPLSTFYKRKTFPSTKQFACVKAKRQPRNSELSYSKDPVISTNLSQPSRHTHRERCSHPTNPLSRLQSQATLSRAHTMPCVLCILSQLQESRSLCQSLLLKTSPTYHHNPLPLLFSLTAPFLKNLVCLTSIMLHLQTLYPSYRSKSSLLMVPSPQLSFQTLVQIFKPLVLVFSHNLMNTLTIC